jgi:hypothetical protein
MDDRFSKHSVDAGTSHDLRENVLAALAARRGERAHDALAAMACGDASTETRKKAVFWLARLRGAAGADVVASMMFNDKNPELRQHGAFAVAQGKPPRAADLIRLGNTDKDGEVRAQAWFWLAQTGASFPRFASKHHTNAELDLSLLNWGYRHTRTTYPNMVECVSSSIRFRLSVTFSRR